MVRWAVAFSAIMVPLTLGGCSPTRVGEVTAIAEGPGDTVVVYERGHGWSAAAWIVDEEGDLVDEVGASPQTANRAEHTESCAGHDCYRVIPGQLRVEHSTNGRTGYTAVWEITGETYAELAKKYGSDASERLWSRSVLVRPSPSGHVVFVANGLDGLLYRDVGGAWHRLGIPRGGEGFYFDPPPRLSTEPAPWDPTLLVVTAVAGIVGSTGVLRALRRRTLDRTTGGRVATVTVAAGLATALATKIPDIGMLAGSYLATLVILHVLTVGVVAAYQLAVPIPERSADRRAPRDDGPD